MTEEIFFVAVGIGASTLGGTGADATSLLTVATFGSAILREDVGIEDATVVFEVALRVRAGVDDFLGADTGVERRLLGAAVSLEFTRLREAIWAAGLPDTLSFWPSVMRFVSTPGLSSLSLPTEI